MSDNLLVKYTGNADRSSATGAVTLGEGRAPLVLGGSEAEVSREEYTRMLAHGLQLEVVGDGYDDLTKEQLQQRLNDAQVDYDKGDKKEDLVAKLRSSAGGREVPPPAAVEGVTAPAGGSSGPGVGTVAGQASVGVGQVGGTGGTTGGGAA